MTDFALGIETEILFFAKEKIEVESPP